jgi:hypothetical protein
MPQKQTQSRCGFSIDWDVHNVTKMRSLPNG